MDPDLLHTHATIGFVSDCPACEQVKEALTPMGERHLLVLQSEANTFGFHSRLRVWTDDGSSVARALRDMDQRHAQE
jgi:hypothetical protein